MPKKTSIKGLAVDFKDETTEITAFLAATMDLGKAHISACYDLAVIRLYRSFESLMRDSLVGALNNDSSTISQKAKLKFPRHLSEEVCLYLVTGREGYFDFHGRDGLIKKFKSFLPATHFLVTIVSKATYTVTLDRLCSARNHAAHDSRKSKAAFREATGQKKVGSAGAWLKTGRRFQTIVDDLKSLADEIHRSAPY